MVKNKQREIEKKHKQSIFFLNFLKDNFHQRKFKKYGKDLLNKSLTPINNTENLNYNYNMNSYNFFFISFLERYNLKGKFIKWESKQGAKYNKIFEKNKTEIKNETNVLYSMRGHMVTKQDEICFAISDYFNDRKRLTFTYLELINILFKKFKYLDPDDFILDVEINEKYNFLNCRYERKPYEVFKCGFLPSANIFYRSLFTKILHFFKNRKQI